MIKRQLTVSAEAVVWLRVAQLVVVSAVVVVLVLLLRGLLLATIIVVVVVRSLLLLLLLLLLSVLGVNLDAAVLGWRASRLRRDWLLLLLLALNSARRGLRAGESAQAGSDWLRDGWSLLAAGRLRRDGRLRDRAGGGWAGGRWEERRRRGLHDGRVLDQAGRQLVRGLLGRVGLAHVQVLDVAAAEDDVLEDLIAGQDWTVGWTILSAERTD